MAVLLLLLSPVDRVLERGLNTHFIAMHRRCLAHRSTALDRWQCRVLYGGIVVMGRLRYPEAATILAHYLEGSGQPLHLPSNYLRRSPVVRRALAGLPVGQHRRVAFHQAEDWRLSYALNPFDLRRTPHRVVVSQWLAFNPHPAARTVFNLGLLRLTVPDGLVLVLHPRPYWVYSEWKEEPNQR